MSATPEPGTETAVLWVRSLTPDDAGPRRSRAIDRLQRLEASGTLDDGRVRLWGKRVRPNTPEARTEVGRTVLERVELFRDWARNEDRSLRPFVQDRSRGKEFEVLLPTMALAEYRDGDLVFVSPCTDAEEGHTVFDRLDALAGDRTETHTPGATVSGRTVVPER